MGQKCIICKEIILNKKSHAKYCSKKCKNKSKSFMLYRTYGKICKECKIFFHTKHKKTNFCSIECSNKKRKKNPIGKKCKICFRKFKVEFINRNRKTFCSKKCSTQYRLSVQDFKKTGKKISETRKRKFANGEIIHPMIGKKCSEETKKKISQTRIKRGSSKGKNNPMFGKKHSNKSREQMSKTKTQKILNGEYSGWFCKGKFFSNKMNKEIPYRSSWEKVVIEMLNKDPSVKSFEFEPLSISYIYSVENRNRYYIPDFLIEYNNGVKKMVEVKPSFYLNYQINKDKFKAAKEYCRRRNILFEIWTEKRISK